MLRVLKLSGLYFALVFGAGFLLGPVRVLLLEPRVGERAAQLIEMPVMGTVIWLAARWLARGPARSLTEGGQLGVGVLAITYVLVADLAVGVYLRSMTLREVFTHRDWVSGLAYYGLLALCSVMIWFHGRRR